MSSSPRDCPRCRAQSSLERVSLGYFFANTTELLAEAPYSWLECGECLAVFTTNGKDTHIDSYDLAKRINAVLSHIFDED